MSLTLSGAGLYAERLTVVLGFVTLLSALATFASCRSCLSFLGRFGLKSPMEVGWYRLFYKYHAYYWWVFLFALVLHFMTAIMHTAIPSAGDPEATIHWLILSFALGSFVFIGAVLVSCRSLVGFLNLFTGKSPLNSKAYQTFYRYHSYYWLILILSIAGHFASAYVHIGIWPG